MLSLILPLLAAAAQPGVHSEELQPVKFTVMTPEAKAKEDALWEEGKAILEPAGINRMMFGSLSLWLEGQYHLGYCNDHVKADDVAFYRTWWEDTVVPTTEVGRYFLGLGTDAYNEGLADGRKKHPSLELCQRTADSWMADMRVHHSER